MQQTERLCNIYSTGFAHMNKLGNWPIHHTYFSQHRNSRKSDRKLAYSSHVFFATSKQQTKWHGRLPCVCIWLWAATPQSASLPPPPSISPFLPRDDPLPRPLSQPSIRPIFVAAPTGPHTRHRDISDTQHRMFYGVFFGPTGTRKRRFAAILAQQKGRRNCRTDGIVLVLLPAELTFRRHKQTQLPACRDHRPAIESNVNSTLQPINQTEICIDRCLLQSADKGT